MTTDGHQQAADELKESMIRLQPAGDNIRLYTEAAVGRAFHLICVGAERRFSLHTDNHQGLTRWLRERGEADVSDVFADLEAMRSGRWYGRQGNGNAAQQIDELLAEVEEWSVA